MSNGGSGTTTREAEAYLEAVREALADLSVEDRRELLEDLELHLAEVTASGEHDDRPLRAVLGAPEAYAAELRAAAGLPPAPGSAEPGEHGAGLWVTLAERAAASRPGRLIAGAWEHRLTAEARSFAEDLRPGWWVLRGFLVVALPAWWNADAADDFPIPSVLGSQVIGALVVAVAIVLSVQAGRRRLRLPTVLPLLVNAAVVVGLLGLLPHTDSRLMQHTTYVTTAAYPPAELMGPHGPVTNILPYGADGKPLENVLLFDQDGRPLRTAEQQWWPDGCPRVPDFPRAADGIAVEFAYPRRYVVAPGFGGYQSTPQRAACVSQIAPPPVPIPTFPAGPADPAQQ